MTKYLNLGGNSGVAGYDVGLDAITVYFRDGSAYLYNYGSTGIVDVEHMKSLATAGQGLNSFISRVVGKRYARKLR